MPPKKIYMTYTRDILKEALDAINRGMSFNGASKKYGIPRSTLQDHKKGKSNMDRLPGRPQDIPKDIETSMVDQLLEASDRGFSQTKRQVLAKTGRLVKALKLKTRLKHGVPFQEFWRSLKRRHHTLTIRKPEGSENSRMTMLNDTVVSEYYRDLQKLTEELALSPKQIWNMDETGIQFSHRPTAVIARKGKRSVVARTSDAKDHITIVACINAAGDAMPPMVIVKGKTNKCVESFDVMAAPKNTLWSHSEKAWTNDVLDEEWFSGVFLHNCGSERPQLFIMDSHSSHETTGLLTKARENGITILALPPHTTSELQPLDKVVFKPLKSHYNRACIEYMSANPRHTINKASWPKLFNEAWTLTMTEDLIKKSFLTTGIYPVNRDTLCPSALKPSEAMDRSEVSYDVTVPVEEPWKSSFLMNSDQQRLILKLS